MKDLSPMKRKLGIKRILGAVSEAYGRMMLYEGLFQADGHPGNILVMKGARVLRLSWGSSMSSGHTMLVPCSLLRADKHRLRTCLYWVKEGSEGGGTHLH